MRPAGVTVVRSHRSASPVHQHRQQDDDNHDAGNDTANDSAYRSATTTAIVTIVTVFYPYACFYEKHWSFP